METSAGLGAGLPDADYMAAGAVIMTTAERSLPRRHDREGQGTPRRERRLLRPDQILFTYLHLAPDPEQTRDLSAGSSASPTRPLPALRRPAAADAHVGSGRPPRAAGRRALPRERSGRARLLLGGVPGVPPHRWSSSAVACRNARRHHRDRHGRASHRRRPDPRSAEAAFAQFGAISTVFSTRSRSPTCEEADLVIGAVLVPGAEAPKLVTAR